MDGMLGTLIMVGVVVVAMYFLMIRPAKKQQAAKQQLMASLGVGSRVMLTSGVYGTIRHLGDKQAIIEISPGVDLTVVRAAVAKVATPDEEEFEYAEAGDADAEAADGDAAGGETSAEADGAASLEDGGPAVDEPATDADEPAGER
ncbi:MAG: preprotein translocase subunit YajC [Propionibacteriaceae bacterium]|jgi:preprotein translocase subunit YajC|nr:preprotein translocase subunit YajC [Propionibacteriaceae bacterium]